MEPLLDLLIFALGFAVIALASRQIGDFLTRTSLPLISGFLFTGILAGPYVLDLIPAEAVDHLRFVDKISLAFIALMAGSKLHINDLRERMRSIQWISAGLIGSTFTLCSLAVFLLAEWFPFTRAMTASGRLAVAILAGAIMVALAPSAVIPVVSELRARGPFTQTVIGVTMITEVMVIALFAASVSIAGGLLTGSGIGLRFLLILVTELALSVLLGYLLGNLLIRLLALPIRGPVKAGLTVTAGYGVYVLAAAIRRAGHAHLSLDILVEPLLVCMIGGFLVANHRDCRVEFSKILADAGPPIYIAFFTLTGASLRLDILLQAWPVALVLLLVRAGAVGIGAMAGGVLAGDALRYNRLGWMAYVSQAGVSLGLAKAVAVEFPGWGEPFTAVIIAVIVLNQIIGPPLLKKSITLAGESHSRAEGAPPDDNRRAVIFGLESQSLALAGNLQTNGWQVTIAATGSYHQDAGQTGVDIRPVASLDLDTLRRLKADEAEAIVTMLSDEENYRICELAYENFGTANLVVRLNERANLARFHELGALIVDPGTAMVNLMDQFVRSPSAASLLLGLEENQKILEVELRNPNLHGLPLRDLRLPLSTLILSIHRQGQMLLSHGYTRLEIGDMVTVVGPPESLKEVELRFDANREHALAYLVGRVAAKELSSETLTSEVEEIIRQDMVGGGADPQPRDRFDRFIEESIILDIDRSMGVEELFQAIAEALAGRLAIPAEALFSRLMAREKESSTAISRWLAIPHIIIGGTNRFSILLARCRQGIRFSDAAPMVHAVFVLAVTKDERNFHLQALSAIAQVAQTPNFEHHWLRAGNAKALREVILKAERKRLR